MTLRRYLAEGTLAGTVEVVEVLATARPIARLRETWFHPQGGGQKADRGTIGGVEVLDVQYGADGAVDHFLLTIEGLQAGQTYPFVVDEELRRRHSNLHSAGHLLSAICERLFQGVRASAGHHWPSEARVDFSGAELDRLIRSSVEIEQAVNAAIAEDLPIAIAGDPFAHRTCAIGDYAPMGCGGTHASSTAALGRFKIRSVKQKAGLVRVGYDLEPPSNSHPA